MAQYAKAIVAGLSSFVGGFYLVTTADSAGGVDVTNNEWIALAATTLLAAVSTWATTNSTTPTKYP